MNEMDNGENSVQLNTIMNNSSVDSLQQDSSPRKDQRKRKKRRKIKSGAVVGDHLNAKEFVKGLGIFSPGKVQPTRMAEKNKCGGGYGWSGMYQNILREM